MLHVNDVLSGEVSKYTEVWAAPEYRAAPSFGVHYLDNFMRILQPPLPSTLIDIGCGTGAAGLEFQRRGLAVSWTDLTDAALDAAVPRDRFTKCAVWDHAWQAARPLGWDYGYCAELLEHLPTEWTMLAVERVLRACRTAWLQVAFRPDMHGRALVGKPLHLTVQPFEWWRDRIAHLGKLVEARDLCGHGVFTVER